MTIIEYTFINDFTHVHGFITKHIVFTELNLLQDIDKARQLRSQLCPQIG